MLFAEVIQGFDKYIEHPLGRLFLNAAQVESFDATFMRISCNDAVWKLAIEYAGARPRTLRSSPCEGTF
ncbi:MAG: hypothetical protein C4K47_04630 [Candidatus Thorarchaeota archaeon]|nr:MAG: hypothetical protein C4K47_04630 [Candidatus Thorarchaeota archaeon]